MRLCTIHTHAHILLYFVCFYSMFCTYSRWVCLCLLLEVPPKTLSPFKVWVYVWWVKFDWLLRINFFFKDFIHFLGKEGGRERNINVREKHLLLASHVPPTGDLGWNPGLCPDRESNRRPFGSQAIA